MEHRISGGAYEYGCAKSERVKYGVLNILRNPNGVAHATSYGDCYLSLKSHIRYRATFTNGDSFHDCEVATCENYEHVLVRHTDNELKTLLEVGCGKRAFADYTLAGGTYKEMQIHGPVNLKKVLILDYSRFRFTAR